MPCSEAQLSLALCHPVYVLRRSVTSNSFANPMDCNPPGSSVHEILPAKYWNGLPCLPVGDLPDPGIKPKSLTFHALAGRFFTASTTWESHGQE